MGITFNFACYINSYLLLLIEDGGWRRKAEVRRSTIRAAGRAEATSQKQGGVFTCWDLWGQSLTRSKEELQGTTLSRAAAAALMQS